MKRLNRFLRWAEGWAGFVTVMMLVLWMWVQGERIDDLQAAIVAAELHSIEWSKKALHRDLQLLAIWDKILGDDDDEDS